MFGHYGGFMLSQLSIKRCYRTKKDDILGTLLVPALSHGTQYDRGTGYFSVDALVELSAGIIPYIRNGGVIRIVTSVDLDMKEMEIIKNGLDYGRQRATDYILKQIEDSFVTSDDLLSLDIITNLIAADKIQIKIAFLPDGGLYHEKIGFIKDVDGESIWFIGSNNETYSGLKKNAESFTVLKSWTDDAQDIAEQVEYFNSLWGNKEEGIEVYDFPDAAKKKLFSMYKKSGDIYEAISKFEKAFNHSSEKQLYPYQEQAIKEFVDNKYNHFFEMATGTGKTFTSVKAVRKMSQDMNGKSLYVLVVVPQIDLQVQWEREFKANGINCYLFGGNSENKDWEEELDRSIIDYHNGEPIVVAICIYDTFFAKINDETQNKKLNILIIVDEAHELSKNQISKLSENYRFRLGLSATPERHSIIETNRIIEYFTRGRIETFKYSIDDAIEAGFLSRYEYYPIIVHLENSENEFEKYQKYTLQLAQLLNEDEPDQEKIQEVLNNRSVIVKKAKSKTIKIKEMVSSSEYSFKNAVIYCGQGKDIETEESIIDNVTRALKDNGKYRVSQFTSKTSERTKVLKEFENGYYDTLVAIKCFDQGVDVPKLDKIYIMASDTLLRQTIQRRGRVLRICKETGKDMAYIFDMVCLPPEGIYDAIGATSLVSRELKRVGEYGRLAENKDNVNTFILKLIDEYNITEDSFDEKENDDQ